MAGIPENIMFLNLPAFQRVRFNELPKKAEKSGALYFVRDDQDAPIGIALSDEHLDVKFYSIIQVIDAEGIPFDGTAYGIIADNIGDVIIHLIKGMPPKDNLTADRDPGENDTEGFSPGSQWFNHDNRVLWVCRCIKDKVATWTPMAHGYGY